MRRFTVGLLLVGVIVALFMVANPPQVREAHAQLPQADIVFKIDESGSMGDDIADVQANVNHIANQLGASVDFQLGLVGFGATTSHAGTFDGEAHIHQTLTSDVPTFQNAVNSLVANGGFEPGFSATVLGESNAMGFRPGAGVCNILISDEDADISANAPETKADALAALNSRNAVFLAIVDPSWGTTADDYGPNVGSLAEATGGQAFDIVAFRADPQPVLDAIIQECVAFITAITLDPPTAENWIDTDHTVTAKLELAGQPQVGVPVRFEVIAGPNAGEVSDPGAGECTVNDDCTTDANGQVSWTYTSNGLVGTDQIVACFTDAQGQDRCSPVVIKDWVTPPNTPPEASCTESVNPSGKKIPPAGHTTLPGPKGGQNEDGFYELSSVDLEDGTADLYVSNASGSVTFGPFPSGSVVKITEDPDATPISKPMGGPNSAVTAHIILDSDPVVYAVDSFGDVSPPIDCFVPPPPK